MAQDFQNFRSNFKLPGATRVATASGRAGDRDLGTCGFCGVFVVNFYVPVTVHRE